ncbi:hypothetical protein AK812_SmicGene14736 [Symbiodinium microadriaticum]|uniref:Uncharacterized protein n=1 Tax=Symbiodinium microadriaticum TaxID=2951 RepID=A0A1Q9E4V7_SYMMI|nr:hypothetical protein AK812_SmicGene14736 [Symbiodinium microadriaticum]
MLRTVAISLILAADAAEIWRVKAKQRRLLAEEALAGSGVADAGACAQRRFPKQVVLWVPPSGQQLSRERERAVFGGPSPRALEGHGVGAGAESRSPPSYQDFNDLRGGKSKSEHFQLLGTSEAAKGNLTELCATLLRTFQEELVDKAARHEGRMYGALTEHWLCFQKAQLCTAKEAPPGKDDDEEEDL